MRMLAAALRWHRGDGSFQDLEESLLDSFAAHVAGDRRVLGLAGDLVDLVDVHDARLGAFHVVVGGLDELQQDVLDILTDVAGLGERGGVRDRKRNVEQLRQSLCQEGLPTTGRTQQHDVRLLEVDVVTSRSTGPDPLVVVVDRHRQNALGLLLSDHVVVEEGVDLLRGRQLGEVDLFGGGELLFDDLIAEVDALVADVDPGSGDELLDLLLRLPAEAALEEIPSLAEFRHLSLLPS